MWPYPGERLLPRAQLTVSGTWLPFAVTGAAITLG